MSREIEQDHLADERRARVVDLEIHQALGGGFAGDEGGDDPQDHQSVDGMESARPASGFGPPQRHSAWQLPIPHRTSPKPLPRVYESEGCPNNAPANGCYVRRVQLGGYGPPAEIRPRPQSAAAACTMSRPRSAARSDRAPIDSDTAPIDDDETEGA